MGSNDIVFHGIDVVRWYWYMCRYVYADMPWQIQAAYAVVLLSILTILILTVCFLYTWQKTRSEKRKERKVSDTYKETFKSIMLGDRSRLRKVHDDFYQKKKGYAQYCIPLLEELRTSIGEKANIQCVQELIDVTGVREYCEECLLKGSNVFKALQIIVMGHVRIQEGRLARYVNDNDPEIRSMARLCYMWCSVHTPYKFISDDFNGNPVMMQKILTHYGLTDIENIEKDIPAIRSAADQISSSDGRAFIDNEIKMISNA